MAKKRKYYFQPESESLALVTKGIQKKFFTMNTLVLQGKMYKLNVKRFKKSFCISSSYCFKCCNEHTKVMFLVKF